jgi:plastocyanin
VRRTAICLGLVGVVAATTGPPAQAAAPPAREGCTWHRHSKRVAKQLKRHGRVQRVKHMKHWWTCDAEPAVAEPAAPPPVLPTPQAPPPFVPLPQEPQPESPASHLSVKAAEWSYTLSRPEVDSGEVIVELNNQGEDNHNLKLQREGSGDPPLAVPEAAPDERTTARMALPPGTYRLYCSLFQHDEKGMHATLLVGGE